MQRVDVQSAQCSLRLLHGFVLGCTSRCRASSRVMGGRKTRTFPRRGCARCSRERKVRKSCRKRQPARAEAHDSDDSASSDREWCCATRPSDRNTDRDVETQAIRESEGGVEHVRSCRRPAFGRSPQALRRGDRKRDRSRAKNPSRPRLQEVGRSSGGEAVRPVQEREAERRPRELLGQFRAQARGT